LQSLDDFAQAKGAAEFGKLVGGLTAVELEAGASDQFGEFFKSAGSFVDNHADFLRAGMKLADDVRCGPEPDLARTGRQDEAEGASSGVKRGAGIVKVGGGADLDPEHKTVSSFGFRVSRGSGSSPRRNLTSLKGLSTSLYNGNLPLKTLGYPISSLTSGL